MWFSTTTPTSLPFFSNHPSPSTTKLPSTGGWSKSLNWGILPASTINSKPPSSSDSKGSSSRRGFGEKPGRKGWRVLRFLLTRDTWSLVNHVFKQLWNCQGLNTSKHSSIFPDCLQFTRAVIKCPQFFSLYRDQKLPMLYMWLLRISIRIPIKQPCIIESFVAQFTVELKRHNQHSSHHHTSMEKPTKTYQQIFRTKNIGPWPPGPPFPVGKEFWVSHTF